jgi:hypothetical protein
MPGQTMILWGTGLGPVSTADNLPPTAGDLPVPVEVRIGGKLAKRLYSGRAPGFSAVDNVYFRVPADAPAGCSVPVQVKAASHWSNTVRMAISADGSQCQDPANPFGGLTAKGGKTGLIALLRVGLNGQLDSSRPPASITLDLGLGLFSETRAGGDFSFSPLKDLPPLGTCASTERALDLESLLKTGGSGLDPTTVRQLDAGAQLTIIGPNGSRTLPHLDTTTSTGPYGGLLGGSSPLSDDSPLPLFLDGGSYTISAPGGADIGAFSTTLKLAPGIQWTNQAQIGTISRSAGVTVKWTGGDASQTILLLGGSTNQKTKEAGGFFCLAAASDGAFTVPPSTLADLPPTGTTTSLSDSIAALAIAALPMSHPQKFTAPGLDGGLVFDATIWGKTVQVK